KKLDGSAQTLPRALAGRVAVVSLWATWCPTCIAELDALSRLDRGVRARGGVVMAVAGGEPRGHVAEFVRQHQLADGQVLDEDFRLADALGQKRVPATLVIDRSGKVVFAGGALDGAALAALRTALEAGALVRN